MTYMDEANLASDSDFIRRLSAALADEARSKTAEELGRLIMNSPAQGASVFMPFVASAPSFGDKYAAGGQEAIQDIEILSAIQACWNDVAAVQFPPA